MTLDELKQIAIDVLKHRNWRIDDEDPQVGLALYHPDYVDQAIVFCEDRACDQIIVRWPYNICAVVITPIDPKDAIVERFDEALAKVARSHMLPSRVASRNWKEAQTQFQAGLKLYGLEWAYIGFGQEYKIKTGKRSSVALAIDPVDVDNLLEKLTIITELVKLFKKGNIDA